MKPTPEDLRNCWNVNRGEMIACESLEVKDRRRLSQIRLELYPDLKRWAAAIKRAARSAFLTGHQPGKEGMSPFVASFDWLIRPETLTLIEEGQYDDRDIRPPDYEDAASVTKYWNFPKPDYKVEPHESKAIAAAAKEVIEIEQRTHRKLLAPELDRIIEKHLSTLGEIKVFPVERIAPPRAAEKIVLAPPKSPSYDERVDPLFAEDTDER